MSAERCECGNLATEGDQCEWCASGECEILVEVIGRPSGQRIGTCEADGRPIYRSHMAGTIYHATEDGTNFRADTIAPTESAAQYAARQAAAR